MPKMHNLQTTETRKNEMMLRTIFASPLQEQSEVLLTIKTSKN